jgi:CubicO group peptidase (beta-lactamase class C family)
MDVSAGRKIVEQAVAEASERFFASQEMPAAPAIVVALIHDGQITGTYSRGALTDGSVPNLGTRFRIASMTKSFTAAAILRLRDAGSLALDDHLTELLPSAKAIIGPTTDSPPVTVRHLLTMSAGLASDDPWGDRQLDLSPSVFRKLVARGATFANPPGFETQYSNYGYALLGSVIEAVTGRSAQQFISNEILAPLGMDSTTWTVPVPVPGDGRVDGRVEGVGSGSSHNTAWGTHRREGLDVGDPLGDGAFAPMGGLWSTANDLAQWVGFLSDAFPPRDGIDSPVLCRASRREMQRVHTSWNPKIVDSPHGPRLSELGYGMGIMVTKHPDLGAIVHHSGGLPGYGSNMRWIPDRGFGIIALANRTYAPMRLLTAELIEVLYSADLIPEPSRRWSASVPVLEAQATVLVDWIWRDEGAYDAAGRAGVEPEWAMNVDLDLDISTRRSELDDMVNLVGRRVKRTFLPDHATAGNMTITTQTHQVEVRLMLSPEVPPTIQWFDTKVVPLGQVSEAIARDGDA